MKKYVSAVLLILMMILIIFAINTSVFAETKTGWQKENNKWYYYDENSYMCKNGSYKINNKLYCFDENGVMVSNGWHEVKYPFGDSSWVYANADGSLVIGWKKIGGKWYYFEGYGYMAANYEVNSNGQIYCMDKSGAMITKSGWHCYKTQYNERWYYLNSDGTAVQGWKKIGNVWYYFGKCVQELEGESYSVANGKMATGAEIINKKVYMFDKSGAWITPKGWYKVEEKYDNKVNKYWWYFENSDGTATTGWKKVGKYWYYFSKYDGTMESDGACVINDKVYMFNKSGAWITPKGWYKIERKYGNETYTYWYYFENSDGTATTEWKQIGGKWYYFDNLGLMYNDMETYIDKEYYRFKKSGAMYQNEWYSNRNNWYYYGNSGKRLTDWQFINGKWYYFNAYGKMVTGEKSIDGETHKFDSNGAWLGKVN